MSTQGAFVFRSALKMTSQRPGWYGCWTDGVSLDVKEGWRPDCFVVGCEYEVTIALASESHATTEMKPGTFMFAGMAKAMPMQPFFSQKIDHVGAGVDALPSNTLSLLCDLDALCAYRLKPGEHYEVTITKLS